MSKTLKLTKELMAIDSITPQDKGCQRILKNRLQNLGFHIQDIPYEDTDNFWAIRGAAEPVLVFAGHTDVVATGPEEQWHTPPFVPTEKNAYLYGRGAADMKGSVAAMIVACENFIAKYQQYHGSIAFLITSAEEGPSHQGTPQVLKYLKEQEQPLTWCVVGEPTSKHELGDMIKNGRRGSLTGNLRIIGRQGHIAYPHLADNPIPKAMAALNELYRQVWDMGNEFFQPTSFQISNIESGTGQGNVIPGELHCLFNFRYCTEVTAEELQRRVNVILDRHQLRYELEWTHFGKPYLTQEGPLINACRQSIAKHCEASPELSTSGGTSDGRYIAQFCPEVIELGPSNKTIHQVNECVNIADLDTLTDIYEDIMIQLLVKEA